MNRREKVTPPRKCQLSTLEVLTVAGPKSSEADNTVNLMFYMGLCLCAAHAGKPETVLYLLWVLWMIGNLSQEDSSRAA